MDIKKTAREIGFFETALNMESIGITEALQEKVGAEFPLPSGDTKLTCEDAARRLIASGKSKFLFLTPEIALIEAMATHTDCDAEVIIAIPCDMDVESEERLLNNLPRSIEVHALKEPYFPDGFLPGNGMIIVCGHAAGEHMMVLPETYRMIEHYGTFMGRQIFIPYVATAAAERFEGWFETNSDRLNMNWRVTV